MRLTAGEVVFAILAVIAAYRWRSNHRPRGARERYRQGRPQPDRLDHLIDDAAERFSERAGHQNLAWPPQAQQVKAAPLPACPAAVIPYNCGCATSYYHDGRIVHDPCVVHDGDYWDDLERREGISQ